MKTKYTINLKDNGIYSLSQNGAVGKSYLRKLIEDNHMVDKDCKAMTYISNQSDEDRIKEINKFNGNVLLLDRLDLYYSDNILMAIKDKLCKVLIDLKSEELSNTIDMRFASVDITQSGVIVEEM